MKEEILAVKEKIGQAATLLKKIYEPLLSEAFCSDTDPYDPGLRERLASLITLEGLGLAVGKVSWNAISVGIPTRIRSRI